MDFLFHPVVPIVEGLLMILAIQFLQYLSLKRPVPANVGRLYGRRSYRRWLGKQLRLWRFRTVRYTCDMLLFTAALLTGIIVRMMTASYSGGFLSKLGCALILGCGVLGGSLISGWQQTIEDSFFPVPIDFREHVRFSLLRALAVSLIYLFSLTVSTPLSSALAKSVSPGALLSPWLPGVILLYLAAKMLYADLRRKKSLLPLTDDQTSAKLAQLLQSCGIKNLQLRTEKLSKELPGAYYWSFLGQKTIVLSRPLLEEMKEEVICAVAAHEIGHALHPHRCRNLLLRVIHYGWIFLYAWSYLSLVFGAGQQTIVSPFFAKLILVGSAPCILILLMIRHALSQKAELAADAYAVKRGFSRELAGYLIWASCLEMQMLNPHPLYHLITSTHPTLSQRLSNIENEGRKNNV